MRGVERTVIGAIGDERTHQTSRRSPPGRRSRRSCRCRSATSSSAAKRTRATPRQRARGIVIGGKKFQVMAGPCSVESEKQLHDHRPRGEGGGRNDSARRRVQAAHVALRIPGSGRERPEAARQGAEGNRPGRSSPSCSREQHAEMVAEYADIFRSARATRRTSNCSSPPPRPASRSCSSAVSR